MTATKDWTVSVLLSEDGDVTRAEAVLHSGVRAELRGHGTARRNPTDPMVPEIGDELATARALSDLAHKLLDVAAQDIEDVEQRARRHSS